MKTAEDLIKWVEQNRLLARPEKSSFHEPDETPEHQALWFVCYQEASICRESYTIEDWTFLFLNGTKPRRLNPREAIQEWLDAYYEEQSCHWTTDEEPISDLIGRLRTHFGLE